MQTHKLLPIGLSCIALLLSACGGDSSSDATPSEDTKTKIVPTKINITIPDGLKNRRKDVVVINNTFQKVTDSIPSYGYEQLTSTITEAEETIKSVKENMIYLGSMMKDIQKACENVSINQACTLPAGDISLKIDNEIHSNLKELYKEFNDTEVQEMLPPLEMTLPVGNILYTQYDATHTYQYDVVVDLQPMFDGLDIKVNKQLETIRWAEDNKTIETISDIDDEFGTFYMHLNYVKKDDTSLMNIKNNYTNPAEGGFPASKGKFAMTLEELNDRNETIKVTSNGTFSDGIFSDSFSSIGQINVNGGYLNSTGTFDGDNKYAEKETFDVNGNILQSKYCDEGEGATCNITDESTWHTFDEALGIDSDNFSDEAFEENDFMENAQELIVSGGTFLEGVCMILPPNFTLTLEENLFDESIGNIFKFEEEQTGILYDSKFSNQLEDVQIFCLNQEDKIEVLTAQNRPTLVLKSE